MKCTAGKILRMFVTCKGPAQMSLEVNREASFDSPGQWIWLRMNGLVLIVLSENEVNRERKQNIWKRRSAVWGAGLLGGSQPAPREGNRKAWSVFPCPGLCCHITEAPLFFPLPTYIACIRTVHCFHFLSALGWLKMHNYHQFAALPVEGPKTITQKKTATASGMLLLSCAPDTSTLLFPNGAFHLYFVVPKQWVVCLFLWFVLDSFWRLKRGKKKRRNWLCSLNMTTKWGFEAERHSFLKHFKAGFPLHIGSRSLVCIVSSI